eukprot:CAMPEP_0175104344 /NCGR_PEP_ID=MMETSP0086_2-20121207/9673_1 /TAXON_ID=136419 /ORGANISM="Unknown Unknown, Strain D1" /LENGTH=78 /DNA_ID=CAMNT_0016379721 /DNA_START=35 /DNA_END=271 /DNA_ORIENTATION=-
MSKTFSAADVAAHNTATDCWIIVDGGVYDITKFLDDHPGGKKVLVKEAGKDCSKKFKMFHAPEVLKEYGEEFKIGTLA